MILDLEYVVQSDGVLWKAPHIGRLDHVRDVVNAHLDEALSRPCFVMFSGGLDSSLLLVLLARRAREMGLPPPTPVTYRFTKSPESSEAEYQQVVIDSLGTSVGDWMILDRPDADVTGEDSARLIAEIGLPMVATLHLYLPTFEQLGDTKTPVSLVTGDGGDELFGQARAAAMGYLLRKARHGFRPSGLSSSLRNARALAWPATTSSDPRVVSPWLTEEAVREIALRHLGPSPRPPWRRLAMIDSSHRRGWVVRSRSCLRQLGESRGVVLRQPFFEADVAQALVRSVPRRAFIGRPSVIDWVYPNQLPRAVLARRSKAQFSGVYFSDRSLGFARAWNGRSLDGRYVDVGALRDRWLSDGPKAASIHLLQAAWAANEGLV